MISQRAAYLVSCAEMADQPYGAPRHTCVQKAGTNIAHLKEGWPSCLYTAAATLASRGTTRHPYLLVPGAAVLEPRPHTLSTSPFRGGESSALADMWRRPLGEARGGQEDRRGVRARTLLRRADVDTHSCGNNICVSERV